MRYCQSQYFGRLAALCALVSILSTAHAQSDANQYIQDTGPIFTYLLDTGVRSPGPLPPSALEEKPGWAVIQEGDLEHSFVGDTVVLNDRIVVVLRKSSNGAEVYARGESGPKLRALVSPRGAGLDSAEAGAKVRIVENTSGAVEIEVTYTTAREQLLALTLRLATGQIQLEMSPGPTVDAIRVLAQTDAIVIPDFFADDLVYVPELVLSDVTRLPAENFFMHFSGGGTTILTCIWQSCGRGARMVSTGAGAQRAIVGSEIECAGGKNVWVAFAEWPGIWRMHHSRESESAELAWKVPFPAKWRANAVSKSEVAQSVGFSETAAPDAACWLDGDIANVRLGALAPAPVTSVLAYPIDRTRATPLDAFLLVDIMRSTLGVGACQYILDLEGLDAQNTPTPELVCEFVEAQLKKKRGRQNSEAIRQRLDAMVAHVEHAEQRIERYRSIGEEIRAACQKDPDPTDSMVRDALQIVSELDAAIAQHAKGAQFVSDAKALAERLAELATNDAWQAPFDQIHGDLRVIGAAQDRALARCRMTLRRLRAYCQSLAEQGGRPAEFARTVETILEPALGEGGVG